MLRSIPCVLAVLAPSADGDEPPKVERIVVEHCSTVYDRTTTLGAFVLTQSGARVEELRVRPGERVKAGQVLGRLHDADALADLRRLTIESESDIELRLAESRHTVAASRLQRALRLESRGLTSQEELDLLRLEVRNQELQVEQARLHHESAELARRRMEVEVQSRLIVAPHDGMVVQLFKEVGECCNSNEPILELVGDDRLRITGHLDVGDAWRVRPGQSVRVRPVIVGAEVPIEAEVFEGKVAFVDPRIDAETRTCVVVAEVENRRGRLRSGIEAVMEILADGPPAEAPDAGR
jgi:RND family efflux transporter MFP subunit